MANIFFTSDHHWGHANILKFVSPAGTLLRPEFSCVEEMDEAMVDRWNAVVRPQDKVYHLGDVAMKLPALAHCARCHGHKRLVRGNHDIFKLKDYLAVALKKSTRHGCSMI
jgi:calcineurin-like phosphoesterase family protein